MWCDNCLLLLPLRGGAIAWAVLLGIYNLVGGILLLRYGQFLYFVYPEWYIYGGISMAIGSVAVLNILSLSNRSYIWTRVCHFLWPVLLVISGVRGVIMILQLNKGQDKIAWECENGGQLWGTSPEDTTSSAVTMPGGICSTAFGSLFTAFIIGILIDIGFQLYMFFLNWRFCRRLEHYRDFKGPDMRGYYTA
ncbi:unnamed protein product [Rhizoctonia solani]|uniref:Uncharacterized protein n=1 Tax=Rhizoctonia solani TaxID=456999 RepID=A0A8H3A8R1_9AGAM|nr:unnamed protein product [Rhizoctonia solani]